MKKIVLSISVLLITATVYAQQDELHGGLRKELRGIYNNNAKAFLLDMNSAYENKHVTDISYDPMFVDRLIANAQIETGNPAVDWKYIYDHATQGPLPKGFRASENATHEMSLWNSQGTEIADWLARDPYLKGKENALWLDGKCIMSLYCANLIREVHRDEPIQEKETTYIPTTGKKQYTAGNGTVFNVTITGGNNTATATGGSSSATQSAPAPIVGDEDEVIFATTTPTRRRSSTFVEDDGVQRYQEVQNTSQKALNWTGAAVNLATAYAILRPPVQRYQVMNYNVNQNVGNVRHCNTNQGNGGGGRVFNTETLNPYGTNTVVTGGGVRQYNTNQLSANIANNYGNRQAVLTNNSVRSYNNYNLRIRR